MQIPKTMSLEALQENLNDPSYFSGGAWVTLDGSEYLWVQPAEERVKELMARPVPTIADHEIETAKTEAAVLHGIVDPIQLKLLTLVKAKVKERLGKTKQSMSHYYQEPTNDGIATIDLGSKVTLEESLEKRLERFQTRLIKCAEAQGLDPSSIDEGQLELLLLIMTKEDLAYNETFTLEEILKRLRNNK